MADLLSQRPPQGRSVRSLCTRTRSGHPGRTVMVGWRLRFLLTICCPAWLADCWDDWRMARTRSLSSSPIDNSRSEEHTSEIQSLMRISYAVFCLKKKNNLYTVTRFTTNKH